MKKLFILSCASIFMLTGCGATETLSCSFVNNANNGTTRVTYDIDHQEDEIKKVRITYNYDFTNNNGNLKKYNEGKPDFWKKEHQVKVWALEFEPIGFAVIHKQEALNYFSQKQKKFIEGKGKNTNDVLHRYYWELTKRRKGKPTHPGENDSFIPQEIRGKHFDSWKDIADELGYNKYS